MSARLGLWFLLSLLAGGYAAWVYRAREIPVKGRGLLAVLRGLALSLLLLLLVNPDLPGGVRAGEAWILEDASPSMAVPQGTDGVLRPPADRARALPTPDRGVRVETFGTPDNGGRSRLAPALSRALEAGARSVEVRTDLRLEDPVAVAAVLESARVPVTLTDLGGSLTNAGLEGLRLMEGAEPGSPLTGEVSLFAEGVDSARLVLEVAGRPVLDTLLRDLPAGRTRLPLRVAPPDTAGVLGVVAAVAAPGDAWSGDDRVLDVVTLDPDRGEVVVVSWAPDWETRFLAPVLAQVTGLSTRAYLRIGTDRFLSSAGGASLDGRELAAALESARLAVVHARPSEADSALARVLEGVPARIDLPGAAGEPGAPGEWYLSPEVPPSPVAGLVSGIPLLGLPPVSGVLPAGAGTDGPPGIPALLLQRSGTGAGVPAVTLEERGARRVAHTRARGFWRWAFREGPSRELYRRFWSGVAGWLLAAPAARPDRVGTGPVETRLAPGSEAAWRAAGAAGQELTVTWRAMAAPGTPPEDSTPGSPVPPDSLVVTAPVDSLGQVALPSPEAPGLYRWEAVAPGASGEGRRAEGVVAVQAPALDLLPPRAVSLPVQGTVSGEGAGRENTRPLRTHPVPYILLVVLLSAEWIGRRRIGLR